MTYNPYLLLALVLGEVLGVLVFGSPSGAASLQAEEGGCC
jgi:hypothetical protein